MPPGGGDDRNAGATAVEEDYRKLATLLRQVAEKKFNVPSHDAEALVNEVFTTYILRRESVRDPERWLVGAVCHASRGYWRKQSRTEPFPPDIAEYADPATNEEEERLVSKLTLALALSRLDCRCHELLRLFYLEGYTAAEVAARFGTTRAYAAQLLHSCRQELRKIYKRFSEEKH